MGSAAPAIPDVRSRGVEDGPLVIGLVNNMPDAALRATERQFTGLLSAAASGLPLRLRLFSLPEVPRGADGRDHVARHYEGIDRLWGSRLDGLIVTGSEPRAASLEDEPYWPALAELVDWAEQHTASTIWSCLAAQAAVLRADGIARRPFGWKLSGVFRCTKAADHAVTAGMPEEWRVPQTRYNDLPEHALTRSGYTILSRLPDAGADMFARTRKSFFLLLQGHPEYDPEALLREYRRDVARFLMGERDAYPDLLRGYFDARTEDALAAFQERARRTRDPAMIAELPAAWAGWAPAHDWHGPTVRMYANWLRILARREPEKASATMTAGTVLQEG